MMTQYMIQGVYTSIVVAVSYSVEMSNIQTAKLGAGMAFGLGVVLFGYAWTFLFRKRPKLRDVPEGSNILTTGFKQIAVTTKQVFSHYKALKWFMIALLWSPEAGAGTILAIAVTFLTLFVNMKVSEISVVSLVMLFSNIPGALLSRFMCKKVNPLNSFRLAEISFAIVNALIAGTVTGPERKNLVYFYAALMGVSFGWMFPSQRTVAVALIPKGQETEIMGLIAFFGQILGFLPAMIFTALNEAGVDMRWGVGSVSFFLLTSCLCTFMCGDFNEAVAKVAQSSDDYLESYSRKSRVEASFVDEDGEVEDGAQDAAVAVNESNHPSEA